MIVGLLSDTHGRFDAAQAAVSQLLAAGATVLIHCGDVGSTDILDLLAGVESYFVFGNTDLDRDELAEYAGRIGVTCLGFFGEIMLAGKSAAVTHGDNPALVAGVLTEQKHDYLFQGHTHIAQDKLVGRVRHINPGALFRTLKKSAALLDTETGQLRFVLIEQV
jgi:putative phosphoesterase